MRRALHPRWAGMPVGLELTAIQMALRPLLGMVVQLQRRATVRARPPLALRVAVHGDSRPSSCRHSSVSRMAASVSLRR
jgi:hypothetical protein